MQETWEFQVWSLGWEDPLGSRGHDNLLQYSCLENPMDGETWQVPVHRVAQNWTEVISCEELTHWKRLWCWEGLGAGGEGDDRGWDGWMALPTRWTWVWVNSGSWWWTGRPGVLRFTRLQRVGHDWATELNWTDPGGTSGKGPPANAGYIKDMDLIPGSRRSPGGGLGSPFQYSCLENPHGHRSLESYSPWGQKESDKTE